MTLELKINAGAWTAIESLGWQCGPLRRVNLGVDTISLTKQLDDVTEAVGIAYGDTIRLRLNGTTIFRGTAQAPGYSGSEEAQVVTVEVFGPWWDMQRICYTRYFPTVSAGLPPNLGSTFTLTPGPGVEIWDGTAWIPAVSSTYKFARQANLALTPPEVDISAYLSARGLILDPELAPGFADYRTVKEEIRALAEYLDRSFSHRSATPPFALDYDDLEDGIGTDAAPRFRTFQDRSVADLIRDLLAARPDVSGWFDYSVDPPAFHLAAASLQAEETLTPGEAPLATWDLKPRPDLKPTGVILLYTYEPSAVNADRGFALAYTVDKYPATVIPTDPGVLVHSIPPSDPLIVQTGVAQTYYEALATVRAEGTVILRWLTADLDGAGWRPGKKLAFAGWTALADVEALIQGTSWDLSTGTVTLNVGIPRVMDCQTFRDLRGWLVGSVSGWPFSFNFLVPAPA